MNDFVEHFVANDAELRLASRKREQPRQSGDLSLPHKDVFRILVCRVTHSLGNTLCTTPLMRELAQIYPGAEIDIVTRSPVANEIYGAHRNVRQIFNVPAHGIFHPLRYANLLKRVRETKYDLVIDPCTRSRTDRLWLSVAKGRYKLGYRKKLFDHCLTHVSARLPEVKHTAHKPVALLRDALGIAPDSRMPTLSVGLDAAERLAGRAALDAVLGRISVGDQPVIGVFANATGAKLLPASWWLAFTKVLERRAPKMAIVEIVPAFARSMLGSRYPAYFSSDVRQLAAVLGELSMLVTADCGVMHLASAADCPVTAIFSVTDADEWGPYGARDCILDAREARPETLAARVVIPDL
jgi:heptosyltransferase-3